MQNGELINGGQKSGKASEPRHSPSLIRISGRLFFRTRPIFALFSR